MTLDARIAALPRRDWRDRVAEAEELTECLRAPGSSARLRPIQGVTLLECLERGGAFVSARVGAGKTLIALLCGELLQEERILVVTPGGLKNETEGLFNEYRNDWPAEWQGVHYKLLGYSDVSRFPSLCLSLQALWGGLGPTLIVCDEVDKLRRVGPDGAAVANQFAAYMHAHPECRMVALTGTPRKAAILDYAHILSWTLKQGSPLPLDPEEQRDWSEVIDGGNMLRSAIVATALGLPEDAPLDVIRAAYFDRLRLTPGVIISDDQFGGPLYIRKILVEPVGLERDFYRLRKEYQRPDGWELSPEAGGDVDEDAPERRPDMVTGGTIWACARQMALGFCYVADPVPPLEWREARRAYFRLVRKTINSGRFYTEFQVRQACLTGEIRSEVWAEWVKIEPTFTPAFRPIWLSDHALEFCMAWGDERPGLIWTDHRAFALKLAKETGWTYYGAKGLDSRKRYISHDRGDATVIASRSANGTGRNLQAFNRMLFSAMPNNNRDFEQNVGRCHREGQERHVEVDLLIGCKEHVASCQNVLHDAQVTDETLMQQKATLVPWLGPSVFPESLAFGA